MTLIALTLIGCEPEPAPPAVEAACEAALGNVCTMAGDGLPGLGEDHLPATETHLYLPQDLSFGPDGDAYVLDWNNHKIRALREDGTMEVVFGNGVLGDGPEGPALEAALNHPTNLTFDPEGNMVVAAWHNSRVEKLDMVTGEMSYMCGDGTRSFAGDGGDCSVAKLDLPSSVAYDSQGRLYISDMANQRIRRVTDGIIESWGFDGTAGYLGDGGPVQTAEMHATKGQAAYPANRILIVDDVLYLTDTENQRVRAVDLATDIIECIAGNGEATYAGDDGLALDASFRLPRDVAMGWDGELYIADTDNHCVRRIGTDGIVSTVAGQCGVPGYEGDGGPAVEAKFYAPYGVEVDPDGNLWVADTWNQVLRKVWIQAP